MDSGDRPPQVLLSMYLRADAHTRASSTNTFQISFKARLGPPLGTEAWALFEKY
jgi:hypothetical protein